MSHAWIFQVLADLRDYALANNLPALAAKAEEAIETAEEEIAALGDPLPPPGSGTKH